MAYYRTNPLFFMAQPFLFRLSATAIALLAWSACTNRANQSASVADNMPTALPAATPRYWHQGKAEISVFDVEQRRYGQMRRAQQVNVFVTEDFSAQKQVKLDYPEAAGADRTPVLKLNALRRFLTGIYDYSVMMSVFSPLDTSESRALKATWSIQDWCGQVFVQANRQPDNAYRLRQFSYFEREGDTDQTLRPDLLEDELWTALRLRPERFEGIEKTEVLPSVLFFRFQHLPLQAHEASLRIEKGEKESILRIQYLSLPRQLSIRFETSWPHRILGWEETDNGQITTRATLRRIRMSDYWNQNDNTSEPLRDSLQLQFFR